MHMPKGTPIIARLRTLLAFVLLLPVVAGGEAATAHIQQLEVSEDEGTYRVTFDVLLDADTRRARALMMDPANWAELSDIIRLSQVQSVAPDGTQRVRMVFRGCVWFFCKTVRRIEDVVILSEVEVMATAIAQLSDFKYAQERWRILAEGDKTRVQYHAELRPDFLIPPLIGPWMIKDKIREVLIDAAHHIEHVAGRDAVTRSDELIR